MTELTIDQEFHDLIPPLTNEERGELERSLLHHGCLDPLKVWQGIIVDGHNRYDICQRNAIHFETTEIELASRDDAKVWILRNQLGRRNLTDAQRVIVAEKLRPLIAPKAKEQQIEALVTSPKRGGKVRLKSDKPIKPINTNREIADLAGVGHDTVAKMRVITEHGTEDQKRRVLKGKDKINKVYREIVPKKKDEYLPAIKDAFKGVTLEEIRARQAGGKCPCCGQLRVIPLRRNYKREMWGDMEVVVVGGKASIEEETK